MAFDLGWVCVTIIFPADDRFSFLVSRAITELGSMSSHDEAFTAAYCHRLSSTSFMKTVLL